MNFPYRVCILVFLSVCTFSAVVNAQDFSDTTRITGKKINPTRKFYFDNGFDAAFLQVSEITKPGRSTLSTLRFSYFLNLAANLNYDLSKKIGLFTGFGIKNIGFIDKVADSTVKRRVYAAGVPLGIKIGNLEKEKFLLLGGGLDVPIHYKEKGYKRRSSKQKTSEWFSDKPSFLMPYLFAGVSINSGMLLKLQFYPGKFLNPSYSISNGTALVYPFANYNANLLYLSVGWSPNFKSANPMKKKKNEVPKKMM